MSPLSSGKKSARVKTQALKNRNPSISATTAAAAKPRIKKGRNKRPTNPVPSQKRLSPKTPKPKLKAARIQGSSSPIPHHRRRRLPQAKVSPISANERNKIQRDCPQTASRAEKSGSGQRDALKKPTAPAQASSKWAKYLTKTKRAQIR